jgi:alcohol dehydrogenase
MRRLMELVRHGRLDLTPLLTHTFPLDQINEAYEVFADGAKVSLRLQLGPSLQSGERQFRQNLFRR